MNRLTPIFAELALPLGGGRRLILAGSGLGWLWLMAGVAAVGLLLLLYRYERRLVSRRAGLTLLGLRLSAAAALVFALFEPVAERSRTEAVRGRVIVGVDLSASMATLDPGRTSEESQRLSKALGLSPSEPVDALPRREVARRLLGASWLDRLRADHDVELVGFARDGLPDATAEALADRLANPPKDDPAALGTDWSPVLERGLEGDGGRPTIGVVLLTDGLQNADVNEGRAADAIDPAADRLAARGVPIVPILIGATRPPRDAAIATIRAPERLAKGDAADVSVTVKMDGEAPGAEVLVTLERPGADPIRKSVIVPADGTRPTVTFRVPMEDAGSRPLTVAVGPIERDARPENDRRTVSIEVVDDKARVLLVDAEARWEFRYLRNALRRDPHVEVEAVVLRPPPGPELGEPTYGRAFPPPAADGPDPLNTFDAVVIGDVPPESLPASAWTRLEAYVDGRGGTLILSAGPRSWAAIAAEDSARKLLPVLDANPLPVDAAWIDPRYPSLPPGVALAPADESALDAWPMLRLAADTSQSRAAWARLPGLPWALGGRLKLSGSALLVARGPQIEGDATAVVAAMPYGLGKVLWVGTDGTWRWRHRVGDAIHHRFWGQVVRWAGASRLPAGNELARFGPLEPRSPEGRPTPLRAQFGQDVPGLSTGTLVAARVFRVGSEGEPVATVPLRPSSGRPRLFEGEAPALPPGRYLVRLDAPELAGMPTDGAPMEVASRPTSELVELAAAREPLERLAAANGGRVLAEWEADSLPPLLAARNEPRTVVVTATLWDTPLALGLVFTLLAGEWALRKRAGLP